MPCNARATQILTKRDIKPTNLKKKKRKKIHYSNVKIVYHNVYNVSICL